ncbi:hypothetical protein AX15_005087 [Amanita polypyramis BW_CC]|nr:hypothetical protein AX15_005087 [Amanita polypyramis BW_CC]
MPSSNAHHHHRNRKQAATVSSASKEKTRSSESLMDMENLRLYISSATNLNTEIKRCDLKDGYKVVTAFGFPSAGKSAFLNLVFGTDFGVMDKTVAKQAANGISLCGAKDINALVMNFENMDMGVSTGYIYHQYYIGLVTPGAIRPCPQMYVIDFAVALFRGKGVPYSRTLLLFVITDRRDGTPMDIVQTTVTKNVEALWNQRLQIKSMKATGLKADAGLMRSRFLDGNREDYFFKSVYKKRIAVDRLALCMERMWKNVPDKEDFDLQQLEGLAARLYRYEMNETTPKGVRTCKDG